MKVLSVGALVNFIRYLAMPNGNVSKTLLYAQKNRVTMPAKKFRTILPTSGKWYHLVQVLNVK